MKRIKSFEINHDTLKRGIYISRVDGDITTYDIRMKLPNAGDYLQNPAMHTIEHLFATYARNSQYSNSIIYFGPMGCRTGFYFLTRDIPHNEVIELVKETFRFIEAFQGEVPGTTKIECGNYLEHDLQGAKKEAEVFSRVIADYKVEQLNYV